MKATHYSPSLQLTCLPPTGEQVDAQEMKVWEGKLWGAGQTIRGMIKDLIHNPDDPELWFDLGGVFGDKAEMALTYYYTAHRIAPCRPKYIDMIARVLLRAGDADGAVKFMDDALGNFDQGTDEYALVQCYKEDIILRSRIRLIRSRLGIDW